MAEIRPGRIVGQDSSTTHIGLGTNGSQGPEEIGLGKASKLFWRSRHSILVSQYLCPSPPAERLPTSFARETQASSWPVTRAVCGIKQALDEDLCKDDKQGVQTLSLCVRWRKSSVVNVTIQF